MESRIVNKRNINRDLWPTLQATHSPVKTFIRDKEMNKYLISQPLWAKGKEKINISTRRTTSTRATATSTAKAFGAGAAVTTKGNVSHSLSVFEQSLSSRIL